VNRIIVFGRIPNPTFDYYLAARLEAPGMPPYQVADIRGRETPPLDADGAFVIICRYASPSVLRWIEGNAERLSGVGLFLDDDIPAVVTGKDADFLYRLFLWYRALWPLRRMNRQLDIVWASTPHLASRLSGADATVLPPAPANALWVNADRAAIATHEVLIAYHATGVHLEEHRFLRPLVESVLLERPQVRFEVFADRRARMIWKGLERVRIRSPIPWEEYLADSRGRRIDIMLVPLSPSNVNDSRAPTKRIDIARYGAVGIFSEGQVFGPRDSSREIRLPYDRNAWRATILRIVDDPIARATAARATSELVAAAAGRSRDGLGLDSSSIDAD